MLLPEQKRMDHRDCQKKNKRKVEDLFKENQGIVKKSKKEFSTPAELHEYLRATHVAFTIARVTGVFYALSRHCRDLLWSVVCPLGRSSIDAACLPAAVLSTREARRITYHMFSVLAHYIFCSPLLTTAGTTKASDATRLPTSVAITVFILCSLALSGDYTVRAQRAQSTANSRSGCVFIHDGRWERMECDIYGGVIKTLTKSRRILPPHENEIEDR